MTKPPVNNPPVPPVASRPLGPLLGPWICESCGRTAPRPRAIKNGSPIIEIILWLAFILPGVIYSIWRITTVHSACIYCSGKVIQTNSPRGISLARQFYGAVEMDYSPQEYRQPGRS
jgi:hypothetical protein